MPRASSGLEDQRCPPPASRALPVLSQLALALRELRQKTVARSVLAQVLQVLQVRLPVVVVMAAMVVPALAGAVPEAEALPASET